MHALELADGEIVGVADLGDIGDLRWDILLVRSVPGMRFSVAIGVLPGLDILMFMSVATIVIAQMSNVVLLTTLMIPVMIFSGQNATASKEHYKCRFDHYSSGGRFFVSL